MSREGEVQVRATVSFIFSALLHAATIAAVLALPQLNLFEEMAGAQEPKAPKTSVANGSIDLIVGAANSAPPITQPVTQPVAPPATPPVAPPVVTRVPAPIEAKPVAKPAPAAPKPIAKPIPQPAARKTKSASRAVSKPVATSPNGDLPTLSAIASARKADQESEDSTATEKTESPRSSIAPIESKATAQAAEEEDLKEVIPPAAPVAAPAPAPAPVSKIAAREAGNGADSTSTSAQSSGNPGAQSTQTASPSGIRDAADLREAPGNPKPVYPEADRRSHREGTVVFLALVETNGTISKIQQEKTSSSSTIDQSAATAFKRYRYQPGQQGWIRKAFTFSLTGEAEIAPARLRQ